MAATIKNSLVPGGIAVPTLVTKLVRGRNVSLGVLTNTVNDAVAFTIPEPTRDNQGALVIQVSSGIVVGTGTFALEASIDNGATWFNVVLPAAITAASFGDPAAPIAFGPITVSGFGSGAQFRFGVATVGTMTGSAQVFALVG